MRSLWLSLAIFGSCLAGVAVNASMASPPPAGGGAKAGGQSPVAIRLDVQGNDRGYVGVERCRACHRAEVTVFTKTAHARLVAPGGQHMDCESCHGPGKPHADAEEAAKGEENATIAANQMIFAFKGTAQDNAARCQGCHEKGRSQQGFAHSPHANAALACSVCHSPHLVDAVRRDQLFVPLPQAQAFALPQPDAERRWLAESQLKASQPALCYSCHGQVRAQFAQPFHHRVPEGAMKCSDCHNSHGTQNRATLTAPGWETCTGCHTDKHGPFLFEHAAVKVEGCAICHSAHGATARFLLVRRESRFLCLQCHGDSHSEQQQVGVPHSRLGFQTRGDCTRCHVAIHGSNFNQQFLQ
jgi:predicted CXXCH cytochrome family protein